VHTLLMRYATLNLLNRFTVIMMQVSGLSEVLGSSLSVFDKLPHVVIVLILVLIGTTFTTFTSNVATTTILLPIVKELVRPLFCW